MIGTVTRSAVDAYQHMRERLAHELAKARAAQRRGAGSSAEVERLTRAMEELRADATRCGIRL